MDFYLLFVYIHILAAIFLVGYTLFWFIVIPPLKREFEQKVGSDLIKQIDDAKWPPGSIPSPVRVKFSGLGWLGIAVLTATGVAMLYLRGITLQGYSLRHFFTEGLDLLGIGKLSLIVIMVLAEFFTKKRSVGQSRLVFLIGLLIVGLSALWVR